jgi:GMP synthase-like glutamine amidotransferase
MANLRLALMDMNNGVPNQGMRGLRHIINDFTESQKNLVNLQVDEFEVRQKQQVPGMDYDIYISSGGPGDPRERTSKWEKQWFGLIDQIWKHNQTSQPKKWIFFICHSFQMACQHFGLCEITRRKSSSFGIYPIHKTADGLEDPLLEGLKDPYYGVDSRDWQLVQPKRAVFKRYGAKILSLEKIRTHVEYERALMAIRFSPEMVGTQFHPEAEPEAMLNYFNEKNNRDKVIRNFSERKLKKMMGLLEFPETIAHTHNTIIPGFLKRATASLIKAGYNEHAA